MVSLFSKLRRAQAPPDLSEEDEMDSSKVCAICWNPLALHKRKKHVAELPCGHLFCKGCIKELQAHTIIKNKTSRKKSDACCPMCRGPLQEETYKSLMKDFERHEYNAKVVTLRSQRDYQRRNPSSRINSVPLTVEAQGEYDQAVTKLEKCLDFLNNDLTSLNASASASDNNTNVKTVQNQKQKLLKKKTQTLQKLIQIIPNTSLTQESMNEKTIARVQEMIELSEKPLPMMHIRLAKTLYKTKSYVESLAEYQVILDICQNDKAGRLAVSTAKKMKGPAHYSMALCHFKLENWESACQEFDLADKTKNLQDYNMAAEAHYNNGSITQAMTYGQKAQANPKIKKTCEGQLMMARIYQGYFTAQENDEIATDNSPFQQTKYRQYMKCVIQAQDMATKDEQRDECTRHMDLLHQLCSSSEDAAASQQVQDDDQDSPGGDKSSKPLAAKTDTTLSVGEGTVRDETEESASDASSSGDEGLDDDDDDSYVSEEEQDSGDEDSFVSTDTDELEEDEIAETPNHTIAPPMVLAS